MAVQRVTREQWGAAPPTRAQTRMPSAAGVAIHNVGPAQGAYSHSICAAKVRGIQRFHMSGQRDGWKDIAYSELVCRHGVRYEGRGYGVQSGANGSSEANARAYAICALIGEGDTITPELLVGIKDAADDYRDRGAGPRVWGHRDFVSTACPGGALYKHVQAGTFNAGTTAPAPVPTQEEDDMADPKTIEAIADAVLNRDDIPAKMLGPSNPTVTPRGGIQLIMDWSLDARNSSRAAARDAAITRSLAEAQAAKGAGLTAEEITAATEVGVKRALSEAAEISVTVKAGETA